jgi:hypothetical protein
MKMAQSDQILSRQIAGRGGSDPEHFQAPQWDRAFHRRPQDSGGK